MHLTRLDAFLVAAAFACVSSSVMLPVLQQMNLGIALKTTLVVEGALSDALGVLGVGAILDLSSPSHAGNATNLTTLLMRHAAQQGTNSSIAGGVVEGFSAARGDLAGSGNCGWISVVAAPSGDFRGAVSGRF